MRSAKQRSTWLIIVFADAAIVVLLGLGLINPFHSSAPDIAGGSGAISAPSSPTTATTPSSTVPRSSPAPPPPVAGSTSPAVPMPAAVSGSLAGPITYTVIPGDNLSKIALWFHMHGYGALYEANKAVIGDNPDLVYPGQRITIANGGMTVG